MSSEQLSNSKHVETDIVIIGAGGAGLTAAVTAAEKGAKVIVIEKGRKPGGLSAMAGGLFGVDSPVQKRLRCNVSKKGEYSRKPRPHTSQGVMYNACYFQNN